MNARRSALDLVEGAVRLLATGDDGIKHRLLQAYARQLKHLRTAEIPAELAPLLSSIYRRLGHVQQGDAQHAVEVALDRMKVSVAMKLADDIFEFHCALSQGLFH